MQKGNIKGQPQCRAEPVFPSDYEEIIAVWEASVRVTHHFLTEEDTQYFKPLIRNEYLQAVDLFCIREEHIAGFLGVHGDKVEMLFIDPAYRGKGIVKCCCTTRWKSWASARWM